MKRILIDEDDPLLNKTLAYSLASDGCEDGTLSPDFSRPSAPLNGKPVILSAMEYKMLRLFCKAPKAGFDPAAAFGEAVGCG